MLGTLLIASALAATSPEKGVCLVNDTGRSVTAYVMFLIDGNDVWGLLDAYYLEQGQRRCLPRGWDEKGMSYMIDVRPGDRSVENITIVWPGFYDGCVAHSTDVRVTVTSGPDGTFNCRLQASAH